VTAPQRCASPAVGRRGAAPPPARGARPAFAAALLAVALLAGCSHLVVLHDPLSAAEHNDLGVAYERRGEWDLAAKEYRRALKIDPTYARARLNLGNVAAQRGHWHDAEREYRRALPALEQDPDPWNNLAVALLRQGRALAEAESLATRAVGLAPGRDSLYRATLAEVRAARAK